MDTEERLMSLLVVAEDLKGAVTMTIEASKQREREQGNAFTAQLAIIADEHEALHSRYEAILKQQSTFLTDRSSWTNMWLFAGVTFLVCAMIISTAYLYLRQIVDKTNIAETRYEELKSHNVKILSCIHEGQKYPCLRVKRSWGGYGDGTIFVIDAE